MAPAAVDTIVTHFKDTGFTPESYDLILTGDLGAIGREICVELTREQGFNIENIYNDCGLMIYDRENRTHMPEEVDAAVRQLCLRVLFIKSLWTEL